MQRSSLRSVIRERRTRLTDLFSVAENANIAVEYCQLPINKSISVSDSDGDFILMDYSLLYSGARERVHMGHELGHCITGSFYRGYSPCDVRKKHEYRADKWAIKKLVPEDELCDAVNQGYIEVWDLAEYFNVTEEFMIKAITFYKNQRFS